MLSLSSCFAKACTIGVNLLKQQTRNTFILKRRWPPPLHKKGGKLPKMRARHFVYDLVQDTNCVRQPDIKVVLSQFIDGVGKMGDILSLRPMIAYRDYLMPGLAVYATPEMVAKYQNTDEKPKTEETYSSPYVKRTIDQLSSIVLQITMNKSQPWTLQPWHVKASFRKCGFFVPEYAIELPPVEIKGPDLSLQEKEFLVTVTINKTEKAHVRCRIHHWATGLDRLPWVEHHWEQPKEPLIPEQAPILENMPLRE